MVNSRLLPYDYLNDGMNLFYTPTMTKKEYGLYLLRHKKKRKNKKK